MNRFGHKDRGHVSTMRLGGAVVRWYGYGVGDPCRVYGRLAGKHSDGHGRPTDSL